MREGHDGAMSTDGGAQGLSDGGPLRMRIVIESARPEGIGPFWDAVLGAGGASGPEVVVEAVPAPGASAAVAAPGAPAPVAAPGAPAAVAAPGASAAVPAPGAPAAVPALGAPARDVVHLDVARPGVEEAIAAVEAVTGRAAAGPYGVGHVDADGHPVDLLGDGPLADDPRVSDWRTLFSAMVAYRGSRTGLASLAEVARAEARRQAVPLRVDLTPDLLVLDGGKDRWELPDGGTDPRFVAVAARVQDAAREGGLTPDPTALRFVQIGIDAVDVETTRAFWAAALDLRADPRPGLTDLLDPCDRLPVLIFQPIEDPGEPRGARVRLEVELPEGSVDERVRAALEAGGRRLEDGPDGAIVLADPGGVRLVIVAR